MTNDLTKGNPLKVILKFFIPVLLGNLFQQCYNIADSIIVGKALGLNAFAAVNSTNPLNQLILGFIIGLCSGFSIPVANFFGSEDMPAVRRCIVNIFYVSVVFALVITFFTVLLARPLLVLMHTPGDLFGYAFVYIRTIFIGVGATMLYNLLAGISRAVGDSRTPLIFLVVSSLMNVGLELLFILALGLGVGGAALSVVLSQLVSGGLCLFFMLRKFPGLLPQKEELRPDYRLIWHLLEVGVPMALQFSITSIGSIFLQRTINSLGEVYVATVAAAQKVQMLIQQPMESMAATIAMYESQNLGAKRLDRLQQGMRACFFLSLFFGFFSWGGVVFFGPGIAKLLLGDAALGIIGDMKTYLTIIGGFYWALAFVLLYRNAVQGLGHVFPTMAAGVLETAGRISAALVALRGMGFIAICFANPTAWIFADGLLIPLYYRVMKRLKRRTDWVSA